MNNLNKKDNSINCKIKKYKQKYDKKFLNIKYQMF